MDYKDLVGEIRQSQAELKQDVAVQIKLAIAENITLMDDRYAPKSLSGKVNAILAWQIGVTSVATAIGFFWLSFKDRILDNITYIIRGLKIV